MTRTLLDIRRDWIATGAMYRQLTSSDMRAVARKQMDDLVDEYNRRTRGMTAVGIYPVFSDALRLVKDEE